MLQVDKREIVNDRLHLMLVLQEGWSHLEETREVIFFVADSGDIPQTSRKKYRYDEESGGAMLNFRTLGFICLFLDIFVLSLAGVEKLSV